MEKRGDGEKSDEENEEKEGSKEKNQEGDNDDDDDEAAEEEEYDEEEQEEVTAIWGGTQGYQAGGLSNQDTDVRCVVKSVISRRQLTGTKGRLGHWSQCHGEHSMKGYGRSLYLQRSPH